MMYVLLQSAISVTLELAANNNISESLKVCRSALKYSITTRNHLYAHGSYHFHQNVKAHKD